MGDCQMKALDSRRISWFASTSKRVFAIVVPAHWLEAALRTRAATVSIKYMHMQSHRSYVQARYRQIQAHTYDTQISGHKCKYRQVQAHTRKIQTDTNTYTQHTPCFCITLVPETPGATDFQRETATLRPNNPSGARLSPRSRTTRRPGGFSAVNNSIIFWPTFPRQYIHTSFIEKLNKAIPKGT